MESETLGVGPSNLFYKALQVILVGYGMVKLVQSEKRMRLEEVHCTHRSGREGERESDHMPYRVTGENTR